MSAELTYQTVRLPSGEHQFAVDALCEVLKSSVRWEDRDCDFWPITGVGVEFRAPNPIVVVPDVIVLNTKPLGAVFTPDQVVLVAEVWSPEEPSADRQRKFDLYGQAEIRYFWTVELGEPVVEAYEYSGDDWYRRRDTLRGREIARIETAPVPVSLQAAQLMPRVRA